MIKTLKQLSIKIHGDTWKVYVISNRDFSKSFGRDCQAITSWTKKETAFYFRPSPSLEDVVHELVHAYLSYTDFTKPSLTIEDREHQVCFFLEEAMTKFYNQARRLHSKLNKSK